jgi:hypothetical protein
VSFALVDPELGEGLPGGCRDLVAGRATTAGQICVGLEADELVLRYDLYEGWELLETHVWVGEALGDLPLAASGEPLVDGFPYGSELAGVAASDELVIPLAAVRRTTNTCLWKLLVAAHAVVAGVRDGVATSEAAWGAGAFLDRRGDGATLMAFATASGCSGTGEPARDVPPEPPFGGEPTLPPEPPSDDSGAGDEEPPAGGELGGIDPPSGEAVLEPELTLRLAPPDDGIAAPAGLPSGWAPLDVESGHGAPGGPGSFGDRRVRPAPAVEEPTSDGYAVTGLGCSYAGGAGESWVPFVLLSGLGLALRRRLQARERAGTLRPRS